jgi:hypothetical protein
VVIVGALMMVYVLFGGMTATTWVQIIKAMHAAVAAPPSWPSWCCGSSASAPRRCSPRRVKIKTDLASKGGKSAEEAAKIGLSIMGPGNFVKDPISAISFGMALMFGTAGLPHILMRFFTVPNAKEARKSVLWATTWIGYFYILTFIIGFGAITLVLTNPEFLDAKGVLLGGTATWPPCTWPSGGRQRVPGLHLGGGLRHHPGGGGRPHAVGRLGRVARPVRHGVQEGQGRQRLRAEGLAHHHPVPGRRRGGAGHRVREAEHRLHGQPGLRDRGQRPTSRCCS